MTLIRIVAGKTYPDVDDTIVDVPDDIFDAKIILMSANESWLGLEPADRPNFHDYVISYYNKINSKSNQATIPPISNYHYKMED